MAILRSIELRNYRRFRGEIELSLSPGINLVTTPPGGGKTTVLEAVSWCLLGNALVCDPNQVPNVEALGVGMTEVLVGLTFEGGERLERSAVLSSAPEGASQEGWRWRLLNADAGKVLEEGTDQEGFVDVQERLFPEVCVHANLISGPSLEATLRGARCGVDRAVECSGMWCCSDLPIRCAMEATGLFLRACPDAPVNTVGYDAVGKPEITLHGNIAADDVRMALLSHALAFAKEGGLDCPIFLDEPLAGVGSPDRPKLFNELIDFLPGRQVVFLLSRPEDIEALRGTGRVDKELEIWG